MKKILIDCDTGIDDSLAILYALKSKSLHIEGITTRFWNTGALQAAFSQKGRLPNSYSWKKRDWRCGTSKV